MIDGGDIMVEMSDNLLQNVNKRKERMAQRREE